MAVESVTEHSRGRTGEWTLDKRTYVASWFVVTGDALDGPQIVINHIHDNGYAPIDGPYSHGNDSDPKARCTRLVPTMVKEESSRRTWLVRADYETLTDPSGSGDQGDSKNYRTEDGKLTKDPLQQHDRVSVGEQKYQRPIMKAIYRGGLNGQALARRPPGTVCAPANSAFMPFSPAPERDHTRQVVRITRALPEWPDLVAITVRDSVCNRALAIRKQFELYTAQWDPFVAKLNSFTGSFEFSNGRRYWDCTLEMVVDLEFGWRAEYLDQGLHAAFGANGLDENGEVISSSDPRLKAGIPQVRRLVDANGLPISDPVRLDGNGLPLRLDQPDVWLLYSVYPENNWNQLEALGFFR